MRQAQFDMFHLHMTSSSVFGYIAVSKAQLIFAFPFVCPKTLIRTTWVFALTEF